MKNKIYLSLLTAIIVNFFNSNVEAQNIKINEFMADNISSISDQDGEYEDWIELINNSSQAINLVNFQLSDDYAIPNKWVFPDTIIPANGYIVIWADNDLLQSGLHASFGLSKSGERIMLSNSAGVVLDSITFGANKVTSNKSTARIPNGTGNFSITNPTFATANPSSNINPTPLYYRQLVINEFMASNRSAMADEYGNYDDWIEIYNNSNQQVSLNGLYLSNSKTTPFKWALPDTAIGPNSYFIVWADGQTGQGKLHSSFTLAQASESIVISNWNGTIVDSITYGPQITNVVTARIPNAIGNFTKSLHSFRSSNVLIAIPKYNYPTGVLRINEIMALNTITQTDQDNEYDDWIEVINNDIQSYNMANIFLSDDHNNLYKWGFKDTLINSKDYLIVWADNQKQAGLHADFKLSSITGDQVYMTYMDGTIIDSVFFGQQFSDTTLGRFPNGIGSFKTLRPTFNSANNISPLPVVLTGFSADYKSCRIELKWSTLQESNNSHFEIERSVDGINFEKIGAVNGAGNSDITLHYTFLDLSPTEDINFYRLKQIDFDGQLSYSDIVSDANNCDLSNLFDIYPNPNTGIINIRIYDVASDSFIVAIINAQGQQVAQTTYNTSNLNGNLLDISYLPKGLYNVKVQIGNKINYRKIIKE